MTHLFVPCNDYFIGVDISPYYLHRTNTSILGLQKVTEGLRDVKRFITQNTLGRTTMLIGDYPLLRSMGRAPFLLKDWPFDNTNYFGGIEELEITDPYWYDRKAAHEVALRFILRDGRMPVVHSDWFNFSWLNLNMGALNENIN